MKYSSNLLVVMYITIACFVIISILTGCSYDDFTYQTNNTNIEDRIYEDDFIYIYMVPSYITEREKDFEEYYKNYLIEKYGEIEGQKKYNNHVYITYYKKDDSVEFKEVTYESEELTQQQIDAGIVNFNIFY